MQINLDSFRITLDKFCDFIPFVSTATNAINLVQKRIFYTNSCVSAKPHTYAHYIQSKKITWAMLIPLINIIAAINLHCLNSQSNVRPVIAPSSTSSNVLSVSEENDTRKKEILNFKTKALEVFQKGKSSELQINFALSDEQRKQLQAAYEAFTRGQALPNVKVIKSINTVFLLDSIPKFVFKYKNNKKEAEEYVEISERARQFINDNNLYLLHVPKSEVIDIHGHLFVMQEKADLLSGSYHVQREIYTYCWHDEEMEAFMKALFTQIIKYICETEKIGTGFKDVKYDNIPLSKDGIVALIDLDTPEEIKKVNERPAVIGLTRGCAKQKNNGALNYIPKEHLEYFIDLAKSALDEKSQQALEQLLPSIRARAQKYANKEYEYRNYAKKKAILLPSQLMNPLLIPDLFKDERKQDMARCIIEAINKILYRSQSFSLMQGRTIELDITPGGELSQEANRIWNTEIPVFSYLPETLTLPLIIKDILKVLKDSNYIHEFKVQNNIMKNTNSAKVVC